MIKLTRKTKSELFKALVKEKQPFGRDDGHNWILDFLNDVWELRAMPSEDSRFKDAYDDIFQHTINNNDWDIDSLFIERLKALDDDIAFNKLIEVIVSYKYRTDEDDVIKFVLLINSYIEKDGITLSLTDYDENEQGIYTLQKIEVKKYSDIPENKITFYVVKIPNGHNDRFSSHTEPTLKPAFVLVHNNGWNDFGAMTIFSLFFYKNDEEKFNIGELKITDGQTNHISDIIPDSFLTLPENFCSLGQSFAFYKNLKDILGKLFESTLYALKDAAFYPDIHDKFEKNSIFINSLLRSDDAERQLRQAKHKIYDYDLSNLYSFKYIFTPKYSKDSIEVDFCFNSKKDPPDRIFAIIGKNGTGKTQLITTLPLDISKKNNDYFIPRPPLFSKVIAVSYSIFDNFEIPKKTSTFNYVYCGLHVIKDNKKETLSPKQQTLRFHNTWKKIKELERMIIWKSILLSFIDSDIVEDFIVNDSENPGKLTVSVEGFNDVKDKLSSGQSIILFIISEIISNIRLDSLILFDEPETHLHPNAISQLMNLIFELLQNFDSYCLIATHSPLIIQEILSRNVYIIERHDNSPSIRKIGLESFGENLTVLTEEVFGNKEIQKQYKKTILSLILKGLDYNQIIQELISDEIPLSLNARLFIKSQLSK
jgi:predicted ATPase